MCRRCKDDAGEIDIDDVVRCRCRCEEDGVEDVGDVKDGGDVDDEC